MPYKDPYKQKLYIKKWNKDHRETIRQKRNNNKDILNTKQRERYKTDNEYRKRIKTNNSRSRINNSEWERERHILRYNNIKNYINNKFKDIPCALCGKQFHYICLDFHHINPSTKVMDVARMVGRMMNLEKIINEIKKCILVCANCHETLSKGNRKHPKWFRDYILNLSCEKCYIKTSLHFHHIKDKLYEISDMLRGNPRRFKKEEILDEIKKCSILCANCHRIEHFNSLLL